MAYLPIIPTWLDKVTSDLSSFPPPVFVHLVGLVIGADWGGGGAQRCTYFFFQCDSRHTQFELLRIIDGRLSSRGTYIKNTNKNADASKPMSDTEQFHQWVGLRFQKSFFLQLSFSLCNGNNGGNSW